MANSQTKNHRSYTPEQVWEAIGALAEQQKETDRQQKETDKLQKEIGKEQKETDRILREYMKSSAEESNKLRRSISDLHGSWKRLTEAFLSSSGVKAFRNAGFDVPQMFENPQIENVCEYDAVFTNSTVTIVMEFEVYYKRIREIDAFVKKLKEFRKYFPKYGRDKIYGAIGSFKFGSGIVKYIEKNGLFAVKGGEDMAAIILNSPGFSPRKF